MNVNEHWACELEGKHELIMSSAVYSYVGWKILGPVKGRIEMALVDIIQL